MKLHLPPRYDLPEPEEPERDLPYGLGYSSVYDQRDRFHLMSSLAIPEPTRRWRYWTPGPAMDQGNTPQCVGYTVSQWGYTSPIRTKILDPTAIYHRAQQIDEWPGTDYDGTSVRAGLNVMREQGRVERYVWAYGADMLARWLLTTGPVMVGTLWTWDMFEPDQNGIVHPTGPIVGGHAYLVTGVNRDRGERGMFRAMNSWGNDWGWNGRFWILWEDMEYLLWNWGEAAAAIERKID